MSKVNLVFFEDKFGIGGIETFITNACKGLDRDFYNISIVVVNKLTDRLDSFFEQLGIKVHVLVKDELPNPIERFKKGLPAFSHYLDSNKCDIIHFNLSDSIDLSYVLLAKYKNMPIRICHSHNSNVNMKWKRIAHRLCKPLFGNAPNYFLACSDVAAEWLFPKKIFANKKYEIIRNGIDISSFSFNTEIRKSIREKENWDNRFIIGNVGRFNIQKNHQFIVDIFYAFLKQHEEGLLVLVGEGELEKEIRDKVESLGISDKVIFWGKSNNVPLLLQGFDVMLMPSLYEGLPYVLIEAQACSLPCVISDTISSEAVLSSRVRAKSLKDSVDSWVDDIYKLGEKERKDSSAVVRSAGFDIGSMVKQLDRFYRNSMEQMNV